MSRPGPADLSARQAIILQTVVEEFISTGSPVGSKVIAGRRGIDFSASTVRYELAALEEAGYLGHPHTSAGRVPTDLGYREYVDRLRSDGSERLPGSLRGALDGVEMRRELDAGLEQLVEALADATQLLGVITAPSPDAATIRHVEVLALQPHVVMVVVITSTGEVTRRLFELDEPVDEGLADWAGQFLKERVSGSAVGSRMIASRLEEPSLTPAEAGFIDVLAPAVTELESDYLMLHVAGQAQFVAGLREIDTDLVDGLLRRVEERYALLQLLRSALRTNEVYLRIGREVPDPELSGLSIVAANYGVARRNLGTVSVMGPTRMDYRLAMAAVREASSLLSAYLEDVYE